MTSISNPTPSPLPPGVAPRAGGGIRGYLGDAIRALGSGYSAITDAAATQADRSSIHPFEGVTGMTAALRDATQNVRGVNKATGLLHMGAGFGMLIAATNVTNGLRAPGESVVDLTHHAADLLDGRDTAPGWSVGWGVRGSDAAQPERASADGDALAELGIG